MSELIIQNLSDTRIPVQPTQTGLAAIQSAGIPWMQACGGNGRCTTCRLHVTKGLENLSPLSRAEERLRENGRLLATERLMCQSHLSGPVWGMVPEETQLPGFGKNEWISG